MEDDHPAGKIKRTAPQFQPTSSAWRTTNGTGSTQPTGIISTHVLRMEDDIGTAKKCLTPQPFQPTSSAWRTTRESTERICIDCDFNPRPPHGGRHLLNRIRPYITIYFNPRPPHGGRQQKLIKIN